MKSIVYGTDGIATSVMHIGHLVLSHLYWIQVTNIDIFSARYSNHVPELDTQITLKYNGIALPIVYEIGFYCQYAIVSLI
jgi:hypothetical protein